MFTLIIEDKDGAIADEYSFEEGEFIVGRSHSSDIILPSDNVSRRHARLYTQEGRCYIEDLSSSNGVFVNGKRIHRVFEIVRSAQIKVGDYYLHVEGAGYAQDSGVDPGQYVEHQQGHQAAADYGVDINASAGGGQIFGRLIGTNHSTQGKPFDIVKPVNLVGRGKDCAITIIDPSVSRIHGKVLRNADGSLRVEDLRSSNGCYVNDERVSSADFGHGDRVRFGNVEFVCELPGMGEPEIVEVSSGGRKGMIFLILFLILVLVGGGVTIFLLRDKIFGPGEEKDTTEEDAKKRKAERQERDKGRKEQVAEARRDLEGYIKAAGQRCEADDWAGAEKQLKAGSERLKRAARLDEDAELESYWAGAERALRVGHRDYRGLDKDLEDGNYVDAGIAYRALARKKGPFYVLASGKIRKKKSKLLKKADALLAAKALELALKSYKRAAELDPTDKALGTKVAKVKTMVRAAKRAKDDAEGTDKKDEKEKDAKD